MRMLSGYVIKAAFLAMVAGVGGLWLLQLVFTYLAELQDISDTYTLSQALAYVLYRSPYFLVQFTPTGVLLGAVVGLGILASNSEMTAMRASGVSIAKIISWVMLPAFLFVFLSIAVNEWVLPKSSEQARQIRTPNDEMLAIRGYWTVIDTEDERRIVSIGEADASGTLKDVRQFSTKNGILNTALSAQTGRYAQDYVWQLDEVHQVKLGNQAQTHTQDDVLLTLPIAQSSVHLLTKDADELSISQLIAHRQLMKHQHSRSKRHELALYQKSLSPFSVLSLLLIACSFVFGSLRSQSLGFRVVVALLAGLLFSYAQDLAGFISLATNTSPLIMVLLPIILGALVGFYLLNKKG